MLLGSYLDSSLYIVRQLIWSYGKDPTSPLIHKVPLAQDLGMETESILNKYFTPFAWVFAAKVSNSFLIISRVIEVCKF